MHVRRCVRAGGAFGHLLLIVVLALGVFVMHTVGHPRDTSDMGMDVVGQVSTVEPGTMAHDATDPLRVVEEKHPKRVSSAHRPAMPMDMLSLCLAVLFGAWVLAALVRSALTRRPGRPADLLARTRVALRPRPPPRGPDLTLLSVLRL